MRAVLVEDHLSFRDSFRVALRVDGRFDVVGEADSARDACAVIEATKPDVAVIDLMLRDTDGVALMRELRRRRLQVRSLMLARLAHPLFVNDAFEAGALGYAIKDQPLAEIVAAMEMVARGERYVSPALRELEDFAGRKLASRGLELLSVREREVFTRLVEGLTAKEIARALCVSVRTVHAHRLQINRKLGVRTPAQLARLTAAEGMHR